MRLRRAGQGVLGRVNIRRYLLNIRLVSGRMEVERGQKTPKLFDIVKQSPVLKSTFGIFFRQSMSVYKGVRSERFEQ